MAEQRIDPRSEAVIEEFRRERAKDKVKADALEDQMKKGLVAALKKGSTAKGLGEQFTNSLAEARSGKGPRPEFREGFGPDDEIITGYEPQPWERDED